MNTRLDDVFSRRNFYLSAFLNDESDGLLSETAIIDARICQPATSLFQAAGDRMSGLLDAVFFCVLHGRLHQSVKLAQLLSDAASQALCLWSGTLAVSAQLDQGVGERRQFGTQLAQGPLIVR